MSEQHSLRVLVAVGRPPAHVIPTEHGRTLRLPVG